MLEFFGLCIFGTLVVCLFGVRILPALASELWDLIQDVFPYVLCFLFFAMSIILILIGFKNITKPEKKAKRKAVFSFIASVLLFVLLPHEYSLTYLRDNAKTHVCGIQINNTSQKENIECIKLKYTDDGKWYTVYPEPLSGFYYTPMNTFKFNMRLLSQGRLLRSNGTDKVTTSLRDDKAYGDKELKFEKFSLMIITSNVDTQKEKKTNFNKVYFEKKYILRNGAKGLYFTYDGNSITMNVNSEKSPGQVLFETTSIDNLFVEGEELKQSYQANYKFEIWKFWRKKGIRFFRTGLRDGGISIF